MTKEFRQELIDLAAYCLTHGNFRKSQHKVALKLGAFLMGGDVNKFSKYAWDRHFKERGISTDIILQPDE